MPIFRITRSDGSHTTVETATLNEAVAIADKTAPQPVSYTVLDDRRQVVAEGTVA